MKRIPSFLINLLFVLFPLGLVLRYKLGENIAVNPYDLVLILISFIVLFHVVNNIKILRKNKFVIFQLLFIAVGLVSLVINAIIFEDVNLLTAILYAARYLSCLSLIFVGQIKTFQYVNIRKAVYYSGAIFVLLGFMQFLFFNDLRSYISYGWDNHLYRLFSTFFDPNFAGVFYVLLFIFLIYEISLKSFKKSFGQIFVIFWTFVAIYLTYSRTALIALTAGMVSFLIINKKVKYLLGFPIVLVFFLILFSDVKIEGLNPLRIVSVKNRIVDIKQTIFITNKSPIFGVGFNGYRYAQLRYSTRSEIGALKSNADAGADNSILFAFATTGVIGGSFFVVSYILLFKKLFDERSLVSLKLVTILTGSIVGSLFVNLLFFIPIMSWVFLLIGFRNTSAKVDK